MQFSRSGAEEAEQRPKKKQPRREGEKHLVSHLRGETHGFVGGGFPDQPAGDAAEEMEPFHGYAKFTLPEGDCH